MSTSSAPVRAAVGGTLGCGAGLILAVAATVTACLVALATMATGGLLAPDAAAPGRTALADIPSGMLTLYQQAAASCPGLPWSVLAAIGKVESDHGRAKDQISSAGALGPMQFLPATFAAYDHPVPSGGANPPTPWDPTDAVWAAARLLCANGARGGKDIPGAIYQYNHDHTYVTQVLDIARGYAAASPAAGAPGPAAARAVAYARSQLGVPYQWGAEAPGRAFDCSGLTQAAYAAAGIQLPRTAQQQYDHGPDLPRGSAIQPGDLVFFGADTAHIVHVGIATSPTDMIDAPHTGALTRLERIGVDLIGETRPAGRP
ncbi:C40 family peptidase [Streptacidiphilus neutrinimicus]|uniref:C40 family peptidase n=1 Tax=Streptacidiphilus neutrinimicus TaxID=105420 RepID=UPI000694F2A8|nr:bifunctional lytic transglycosylase/C40 family peptidase [Streptacidiphilus neutrinimicus]